MTPTPNQLSAGLRLNERIRRRTEFKHVYEQGTRVHGRYSTIFVLPNNHP